MSTKTKSKTFGRHLRADFLFDEDYVNLNHGSFGTYPSTIRDTLRSFQDASEARPDQFIRYDLPHHLSASRAALAHLVNAPVDTVVLVPNATTGINTVLRNLVYEPGDVIVYFATIYGSCEKTVQYVCEMTQAEAVRIEVKYPMRDEDMVALFVETVEGVNNNNNNNGDDNDGDDNDGDDVRAGAEVSSDDENGLVGNSVRRRSRRRKRRVKVAIFDTVTSLPGVRVPFERLVAKCKELGVLSCVDAAHAVGHIQVDLTTLDPDFFVSNCHKWLYTPRGCALFYVPQRNQHLMRSSLPTSHGFQPQPHPNNPNSNTKAIITKPLPTTASSSPFTTNFEFVGTLDNSAYLCIPAALAYRRTLGGEEAIRGYCRGLARDGGRCVAGILGTRVLRVGGGDEGDGDEDEVEEERGCCFANVALPISVDEVRGAIAAHRQHHDHQKKKKNKDDKDDDDDDTTNTSTPTEAHLGITIRDWLTLKMVQESNTFMALIFYQREWWVRLSAQVYLEMSDFEWGARVLKALCERVRGGEWMVME